MRAADLSLFPSFWAGGQVDEGMRWLVFLVVVRYLFMFDGGIEGRGRVDKMARWGMGFIEPVWSGLVWFFLVWFFPGI